MTIVVGLVVALLVGLYAQKGKGRTGALWGFLVLLLYVGIWVATESVAANDPQLRVDPNRAAAVTLVAGALSLVVGLLVVLTLPKKSAPPAPSTRV